MRFNDFTGVGRIIDPRYATNALVLILMGLAWLMTGSVRSAAAVFFAWSLARELDPDREWSAFLPVALVVPFLFTPELSSGPLFWLLLVVRIVNRTSGRAPTWVDSALTVWVAWQANSWGVTLLTAAAFAADALLSGGRLRELLFAAVSLALGVFLPVKLGVAGLWQLIFAVPFAVVWLRTYQLDSRADRDNSPLDPIRIRAGQIVFLSALLLGLAEHGPGIGLLALGSGWAALWGTSLGRLISPKSYSGFQSGAPNSRFNALSRSSA